MFMRVSWGTVRAGEWERYEADFKKMAASDDTAGLVGRYLARDLENSDAGFSISIWSSLDAIKEYDEQRKKAGADDKISKYFTGKFTVTVCEIEVDSTK